MPEMFGYSFTPGLQRRFTNAINGQSVLTPGQSQALQVLALRLPGFLGGAAPAPEALLRRPVGGLRPDAAVRAQVAPPQAAVSPSATDQPVSAAPQSPLSSPDTVSPLQRLASLFSGAPSNPFGGQVRDAGPSGPSAPGGLNFTFERPGQREGDPFLPLPPAYGGPNQPAGPPSAGDYTPSSSSGFNGMMDNLFAGRQGRYI
jgi:hypothetical protein